MEAEGTSTTHESPLQLIQERIIFLQNKFQQLTDGGGSVDDQQKQYLISSKLCVLMRLDELHNLKKKLSHHGLVDLVIHYNEESGVVEGFKKLRVSETPRMEAATACAFEYRGILSENTNTVCAPILHNEDLEVVASVVGSGVMEPAGNCVCSFQKRSSLNQSCEIINQDEPSEKERYLCVSDGFVIYILDLKQDKDESKGHYFELQPLPSIHTFNLRQNGLPFSMGLFKLGPDVYMVGGQEFPAFKNQSDLKLTDSLYENYGFDGSSRKTYHLSFVNGNLSLSLCNHIPLLNKPKLWPIVEKIGNKVHVIESVPFRLDCPEDEIIPSHEVLNLDHLDHGWGLSPMCYPRNEEEVGVFIRDHLVVGEQIYGKPYYNSYLDFLAFNSKTNKWELHGQHFTSHVMHNFGFAKQICVGEFLNGEFREPLYVTVGVGDVTTDEDGELKEMIAQAHLVNEAGHIFSIQNLPNFFEGVKGFSFIRVASLFKVNEEGKKKNMCAVVLGTDIRTWKEFLFISTFSVEAVAIKPRPRVSLLFPGWDEDAAELPYPVAKDFVNVVVKNRHVYKVGTELRAQGTEYGFPPRLRACFI